jgi:V-type H+-transporting ATPase subunit a
MKMSVVLGVIHVCTSYGERDIIDVEIQMTFALCLQLPNHLKFKRKTDIYANFIPQIIFLESIFGYLVVCILYKWTIDWSKSATDPPSLLNMLIEMVLSPGQVDPKKQLYRGQSTVQTILLLLAGICVPWLLFTKPYLVWKEMHKTQGQGYVTLGHESAASDDPQRIPGVSLEDEEEGDGHAMIQDSETDEVCVLNGSCFDWLMDDYLRNTTTLAMWLFIKSFTPLNSASGVSRTRRLTSGFGRCRWPIRSYRRFFGR